jgi:hypothetical protein
MVGKIAQADAEGRYDPLSKPSTMLGLLKSMKIGKKMWMKEHSYCISYSVDGNAVGHGATGETWQAY